MKKITKEELAEILVKHKKWRDDSNEGERANLSYLDLRWVNLRSANLGGSNISYADLRGSNLRGADLSDSNLRGAVGNMREVKSLSLDTYSVTYTSEVLQIACECHLISEWWGFDDKAIGKMDIDALAWWVRYKKFIKMAIEISPAVPTGHETSQEVL